MAIEPKPPVSTKKQEEPKDSKQLILESIGLLIVGLAAVGGIFYMSVQFFGSSAKAGLISIGVGYGIFKLKEHFFDKD